ncbi:DNA repair protein rad52 [Mortierella claussenii]|nr:DNA repair protein rad52 [Mortierella claussenii]
MIPKPEPDSSCYPLNLTSSPTDHHSDIEAQMSRQPLQSDSLQRNSKLVNFTSEEKARLDVELTKYLAPEFAATRAGPGRATLTYIEGWRIKNLANKLFGFDGWSSAITDVTVDFLDVDHDGRVAVGVSVMVRVTLKDGTFHEDIGYGSSENQKSKAASLEKAKKEATTDGLKRALTSFGNVLGTCLYDKNYCRFLSTQRVEKPRFNAKEIHFFPTETSPTQQGQSSNQQQLPHQQEPVLNNQHQHVQQNQSRNQQNYNPYQQSRQNHQQGFGTGSSVASTFDNRSNPYQTSIAKLGSNSALQPPAHASAGSSSTTSVTAPAHQSSSTAMPSVSSTTVAADAETDNSIGAQNQSSNDSNSKAPVKVEDEDDDDLFFGADIEDTRASQPESPRLSDFDIEMDVMDMMAYDSPVRPKTGTAVAVDGEVSGTPTLKRSGTFSRSTSSPSVVQTTPTKVATEALPFQGAQQAQVQALKPVPFRLPKPANGESTTAGNSATAYQNNPFVSRPTSATPPSTSSTPQSTSASNSSVILPNPYLRHSQNQSSTPTSVHGPMKPQPGASSVKPSLSGNKNVFLANSIAGSSTSSSASSNQHSKAQGFRAGTSTPSTIQHGIHFANSAQGTGLKRPLGVTTAPDAYNIAVHKEPRLG